MIKLVNVSKIYGAEENTVRAVQNANMDIQRGDFISIVGPSGCGKTTLLNMIGCLLRPSSGELYFDGQLTGQMSDTDLTRIRNRRIGFIFQGSHLIPTLNVLENVMTPIMFAKDLSRNEKQQKRQQAMELIEELGLAERINHLPHELSLGQRRRVAIARALINNPDIILADEPTNDLDPERAAQIAQILMDLNRKGQTLLMITHMTELAQQAKIQYTMRDGQPVLLSAVNK